MITGNHIFTQLWLLLQFTPTPHQFPYCQPWESDRATPLFCKVLSLFTPGPLSFQWDPGQFVLWNFCSLKLSFPGNFTPWNTPTVNWPGNFHSPELSFSRVFPLRNFCSLELSFPGNITPVTFTLWSELARELSFPRTFIHKSIRSQELLLPGTFVPC